MHKQLVALIPNGQATYFCNLFSYSSKGIPGIEIVGLGHKGKSIREKIIYLNKLFQIKAPPRRYVLCVEDRFVANLKDEEYRWLELPFLLMYWSMAQVIPIRNLSNCLCGGLVNSSGEVTSTPMNLMSLDKVNEYFLKGHKIIAPTNGELIESVIPLEELFNFCKGQDQ